MITLKETTINDIVSNMSQEEIGKYAKTDANSRGWMTEIDSLERLDSVYGEMKLDYEPKMINGYKCYGSNGVDGVVILDKDDKLVCIIDEYDMMNVIYFEDVVIVPGRDSMTMFSTITGIKKVEQIR